MKYLPRFISILMLAVTLASCDNDDSNTPPTVDAGVDQTVNEQTPVSLSGTAHDNDGSIVTYLWTQTKGTSVTINNTDSLNASFNSVITKEPISLEFQLTVTDNAGSSSSDSVAITVNPVNAPPDSLAGDDLIVLPQNQVTLSGSGSDADGTIISYHWTQTDGEPVELISADTATATFIVPSIVQNTDLVFSFTVTDDEGASDTDNLIVTIQQSEFTVSAGSDLTALKDETINLTGSIVSQNIEVTKVEWIQISGPAVELTGADSLNVTFTPNFFEESQVRMKLTVTDIYNRTAEDYADIYLNRRKKVLIEHFNDAPNGESLIVSASQNGTSCDSDSWTYQIESQASQNYELTFDVINYHSSGMGSGSLDLSNNYLSFASSFKFGSNYKLTATVISGKVQLVINGTEEWSDYVRNINSYSSAQNLVNIYFSADACSADFFADVYLEIDSLTYSTIGE